MHVYNQGLNASPPPHQFSEVIKYHVKRYVYDNFENLTKILRHLPLQMANKCAQQIFEHLKKDYFKQTQMRHLVVSNQTLKKQINVMTNLITDLIQAHKSTGKAEALLEMYQLEEEKSKYGMLNQLIGHVEEDQKKYFDSLISQKTGSDRDELTWVRDTMPVAIKHFEEERQDTENLLEKQLRELLLDPKKVDFLFDRDSNGGFRMLRIDSKREIVDVVPSPAPDLSGQKRILESHRLVNNLLETEDDKNWEHPLKAINSQLVLNTVASAFIAPLATTIKMKAIDLGRDSRLEVQIPEQIPPLLNEIIRDKEGNIQKVLLAVDVPFSLLKPSQDVDSNGNPKSVEMIAPNFLTASMKCEITLDKEKELSLKLVNWYLKTPAKI